MVRLTAIVCVVVSMFLTTGVTAAITTLSDIDTQYAEISDIYFDKSKTIPVDIVGSTMAVTLDLDLVSIVQFDDDTGYVTMSGYLTITWTEERYTRVADAIDITVPATAIWKPPISIVNTVLSTSRVGSDDDVMTFSLDTAQVVWKPWVYTKVSCDSNSLFPFDTHVCSIQFSSLDLDSSEMTLVAASSSIGTNSYHESSIWNLTKSSATSSSVNSHSYVEYKVTIERKSQLLAFLVICPLLIMGLLHLFAFFLPNEAGQRSNYSIMNMIGVIVILLWAMTYMPSNIMPDSIIMYYMCAELLLNAAVTFVAVVLLGKFERCDSCSWISESLVPKNKSSMRSKDSGSGRGSVAPIRDTNPETTRNVRISSIATAWDDGDDAFDDYQDEIDEHPRASNTAGVGDAVACCSISAVLVFVFFLALHICVATAFFVYLALHSE